MSHKLEGQSVTKAHELIKQLAKHQVEMEKGHFDTLRTVLKYVKTKYPTEPSIKYPTAQAWLNLKRNRIFSLATILSISLILLIFNVLLTVNSVTKRQINQLSEKITLNIYLANGAETESIKKMQLEKAATRNMVFH